MFSIFCTPLSSVVRSLEDTRRWALRCLSCAFFMRSTFCCTSAFRDNEGRPRFLASVFSCSKNEVCSCNSTGCVVSAFTSATSCVSPSMATGACSTSVMSPISGSTPKSASSSDAMSPSSGVTASSPSSSVVISPSSVTVGVFPASSIACWNSKSSSASVGTVPSCSSSSSVSHSAVA